MLLWCFMVFGVCIWCKNIILIFFLYFWGFICLSRYVYSMVTNGIMRKRCTSCQRSLRGQRERCICLPGVMKNPCPLAQSDRGRRIKVAAGVLACFKAQKLSSRVSVKAQRVFKPVLGLLRFADLSQQILSLLFTASCIQFSAMQV